MRPPRLAAVLSATLALSAQLASAEDKPAAPAKSAVAGPRGKAAKKKEQGPLVGSPGFEMLPNGGSRVYLHVSAPVTVTEHASPGQVSYLLENARVDVYNSENALETFYFNTPAMRVRLHRQKKKDVELAIALRADVKPTYRVVENKNGSVRLEIDFPPGSYLTADAREADRPPPPPPPQKPEKDEKKPAGKGPAKPAPKTGPQP